MPTNPPDQDAAVHQLRMLASGRVQGVGYRVWATREAERLGVTGSIRNRSDGRVEVLARGTSAALDRFHQLLARGPSGADVESVTREPADEVAASSFDIVP